MNLENFQRIILGNSRLELHLLTRILMCFLVALFLSISSVPKSYADAPKTCIPLARSVPGFSGDPPDWWTSGQTLGFAYTPEDPRWLGAVSHDYGMGSTSKAEFRALYKVINGRTHMYLSWYVKVSPQTDPNNNVLYIGLFSPGEMNATIIKFILKAFTTKDEEEDIIKPKPENEGGVDYYTPSVIQGNGTTDWETVSVPPWVTDKTRVWIKGDNPYYWAVQMVIPIDNDFNDGINISNTSSFRMWYYIQVGVKSPDHEHCPIIPYTWPRTEIEDSTEYIYTEGIEDDLTPTYPDPSTWAEVSLQNPEPDISCQVGISISASQIGTTGTINNSKIDLEGNNKFYAKPINYSTVSVPPKIISATFRIANWGSQVGDLTSDSWEVIPGGLDVPDTSGINGYGHPAGYEGNITFKWKLDRNNNEHCPFVGKDGVPGRIAGDPNCPNESPTRTLHQCVSVKLTGPGLNFIRDSAYRNMDFVDASKFSRKAEISVIGLPSLQSSDKRDVYLYIEQRNMPKFTSPSQTEKYEGGFYAQTGEIEIMEAMKFDERKADDKEVVTFDDVVKMRPTYIVHAYHDTGKIVTINGDKHPLLMPQTSFGYFLNHEGDLEGWSSQLKGAGLVKLSPYWYKIAVPNDGVATVTTTIKAIEPNFAISVRLGSDIPHGTFSTMVNSGLSLNAGIEYLLSRYLSIEAIFGYHHFTDNSLGTDQKIYQFSSNVRYFYPLSLRLRSFIIAGAGMYSLEPGDSDLGYNAGVGIDLYLTNQLALEAVYNFHNISNVNYSFSTLQLGFRYRF